MTIYLEEVSLATPWAVAESRLDATYGEPERRGDAATWCVCPPGPYRVTVTAHRASNRFSVAVSTPLPYRPLVALASVLVIAVFVLSPPPVAVALIQLFCLCLAGIGVLPSLPYPDLVTVPVDLSFEATDRTLSADVLPPVVGAFAMQWYLLSNPVLQTATALAGLVAVAAVLFRSDLVPSPLGTQALVFLVPAVAVLPSLVAASNVFFLGTLSPSLPAGTVLAVLGVLLGSTAAFAVVFGAVCRRGATVLERLPNEPLSSPGWRVACGALFGTTNAVYLFGTAAFLTGHLSPTAVPGLDMHPVRMLESAFLALGLPVPGVVARVAVGLLVSPVLLVGGLWTYHFLSTVSSRRRLVREAPALDGHDVPYPVLLVESPRATAHAIRTLTGTKAVVVSSALVAELADDELAAVLAHETYHLDHADPRRSWAASAFGLALGGKTAFEALFDYPAIERRADAYAADEVGTDSVTRALRRIEQAHLASGTDPPGPGGPGVLCGHSLSWLRGPYHLLFGHVVVGNAHASVDDRIAFLYERDRSRA